MNGHPTNPSVLYVEDEECDRLFMEVAFRKAGMGEALRAVLDGREAMNYLEGSAVYGDRGKYLVPAVVLLDLNLPLVSGFEVLQWIRGRPELATLPVVIFSSSSKDEDKVRARELGANEFVEKPMSAAGFVNVAEGLKERWLGRIRPQ